MANSYTQFLKLLPKRRQVIGKVLSVNTTSKTSRIELLGGSAVTVKGEGVVDSYYLVEEGVIQQELPALTAYSVTIP